MDVFSERSYPTPVSNSPLLPWLLLSLAIQRHTPSSSNFIKDEYDYIIVGGGSAGSIVASRLSEDPCISVLLLEAGHGPPRLTEVPAFAASFAGTEVDWKFKTVPQKHAGSAHENNQMQIASAKMLGGSGNHNYMAYFRGNRKNYDDWEALGAKGWSYNDVLPYFLRLEDFRIPKYLENGYHATGGPITVEYAQYVSELKPSFYKAAKELGYTFGDYNAERQTGFLDFYMNVRNGQRCSSVKGYLVPAEKRENLDILLNSTVTKVLIKRNQVNGVKFQRNGQWKVVKARKEVIVSAGTINTPKLLMLSGLGPRTELQRLNIPVIKHLPVGRNLHDHCMSQYLFTVDPQYPTFQEKLSNDENIIEYILNRTGPLTSGGDIYSALLHGSDVAPEVDFPNLILYIREVYSIASLKSDFKPEVYEELFKPYENKTLYTCVGVTIQPKSRGTITLKSSDPFEPPLIDPNYLKESTDLEDIVEALKVCQKLLNTTSFRRLGAKPLETKVPGCEMYSLFDDNYLRCYARATVSPFLHAVGTSRMGDPEDSTTVVDPELRVKNIEGLRVVDASVMPIITSGNINVPTMMIAEKASSIIKNSITCNNG